MPRGSQVIYPKDLGNILVMADIFPGAVVVEGGLGSGALTSALLRAVGPEGRVITYEVREDMVKKALSNIGVLAPGTSSHTLRMGDIYQGIQERNVDRVVLDVPEPWHVVPSAAQSLAMGGILLSFLPTILQVHRLADALSTDTRFQLIETVEVLLRPWNVTQRSVRPAHRMVAHSGFYHHGPQVRAPRHAGQCGRCRRTRGVEYPSSEELHVVAHGRLRIWGVRRGIAPLPVLPGPCCER